MTDPSTKITNKERIPVSASAFRGKRRWGLVAFSVVGLMVGILAVASYQAPLSLAQALGRAAKKENVQYIVQQIDYPALRVNMQGNLYTIIRSNDTAHHLKIPKAAMHAAAANGAAHMATPSGVTSLLRHTLPQLGKHHIEISQYTYSFLSWNRFQVLLTGPTGGHVQVVFYRKGWLHWAVGDIAMLPPGMPTNFYPAAATMAQIRRSRSVSLKPSPIAEDSAPTRSAP